jgi:hypothetical protein
MSRLAIWLSFCAGGLIYWGAFHGFSDDGLATASATIYFSGMTLFFHWVTNRKRGAQ